MAKTPCVDILKNSHPDLYKFLEDKNGVFEDTDTSKQAYIKAAKELQELSLSTIQKVYEQLGIGEKAETVTPQPKADVPIEGKTVDFTAKGGNKVVDESGEPITVYHGSDATFNEFKKTKSKRTILMSLADVESDAHFFSNDKEFAKTFGKNVKEYHVSIKNPAQENHAAVIKAIKETYPDGSFETSNGVVHMSDYEGDSWIKRIADKDGIDWFLLDDNKFINNLKKEGVDGTGVWEDNGSTSYAVFDKSQIKEQSLPTPDAPIEGKKPDVVVDKKAETEKSKPLDTVPSIENKNAKDEFEVTQGVIGKVGKFVSRIFGGKASEKVYIAKDSKALMDKAGELETSKDRVQFMFKEAFIGAVAMLQPMTLKNSAVVRTEQVSKILSKDEKSVIDILNNYYKENDETPPKDVIDRALYLWDKFGRPEIVGDSTKNNERAFAVKGEKTLLGNITNFDDFIAELSHAAQYISGKKLDDKQYDNEAQRDSLEYKRKGSTEYNAHQLIEPILAKYIFSGDSSQLNKISYQNKDGKILGFTHNGKIYLNGEHLNPETPIHEAGHIWAEWVKQNNTKVYNRGIELVKGSKYLKQVKETEFYQSESNKLPEKDREQYYQHEALAAAIGDKGAQFVSESRKAGFKEWLNNLWNNIKNAAGFKDISAKELQNLTFDEFTKRAAKDILDEPTTNKKEIPAFHKKVDDVVDSLIKEKTEKKFEAKAKEIADKIRSGKINKLGGFKSSTGFDAVWDASLEIVAETLEATGKIADAIAAGLNHIRKSDWYKNLTDKKDFEDKYIDHLNKEFEEKNTQDADNQSPKPPVDNVTEGKEDDGRGIKHASTAELRSKYNLGSYDRDNATDAELEDLADTAIEEGYDPEALIRQMESGTPPTGVENFIIKKYLATLEAKFDKNPSDENLAPIERLVKATDKIGSLQSEAFRTRKGLVPVDDSLAGYFITEKEVNLDAPLTDGQKTQVKKEFADITEAQKKYEDKLAALQAENDKMRADLELKKEVLKKSKTKRTHEDFVNERRDILNDIKAKLKKARGETNVTPIPYAKELVTIAPDVAKLVRNLVEEGFTKLSDIVADIHDSLKDSIKGITTQDVYAIIAGDYNENKQTKNEISKQIFDLKTEAQLIGKYEKLKEGIEPKNEKEKIKRNQELEKLRKQIKEDDLSKLAVYKSQAKARIAKLEDDLAKGKYESDLKPPSVKLDKEAIALKDKYIKLKNERHFRLLLHQHRNMSKRDKAVRLATEILNIPRTLMTIVDYSAVLRQGIIQSISHPSLVLNLKKSEGKIKVGGAAIEMFKAGASQKIYDRWFFDLKETPRYEIMEQSKLGVTDSTSPLLSAREEDFMSNLAEKIPILGKTLTIGKVKIPGTNLVKGSERSYSMFLNKLRVDLFNRFADAMEERGATFENSPEAYKQMAEYINNSTGRGSLGKTLNKIAPTLNALFFSPRLIASRLNMLTYLAQPRFYSTVPKEVRRDYFIGMAKFIALGSTVVGLAALGGNDEDDVTVETDPRSSDFGKIKHKNTRWDVWGGFQPYIRVAAQAITGDRKTASGEIQELSGDKPFGQTKGSVIINFARSKLAPVPGMAVDFYTGETIIGEKLIYETREPGAKEIMVGTYFKEHLLPLTYTGLTEAMKDQGVKALFTVGVPSVFGVGTQTYEASKGKFQTITIKNPKTFKERSLTVEEDKKYRETIKKDVPILLEKFTSNNKTLWVDVNGKIHLGKEGGNITNAEKATWKVIKSEKLSAEQMDDLETKVKKKVSDAAEKTIKF